MTTIPHPMRSCMDGSLGNHYRVVISPSNQGTLPTTLIKKSTTRSKPSKKNFTIREPAVTSRVLNSFEPVFVWTLGSISGNKAGFSTAKTLTGNQEHILLKWMVSWTKEQESTCDQRVLSEGPPVPIFSQTTSETVFGQEWFIKQPVTALT